MGECNMAVVDDAFSVVLCVYHGDNPEWFQEAVNSILNQSRVPDQIVLTVDGPVTDELDEIIRQCEENPIFTVNRIKENVGHGGARRQAFERCSNELIALMDADDLSTYNRFEKQLEVFKNNPDVDVVGGNILEFIDKPDNVVAQRRVFNDNDEIRKDLKVRCPMNHVTVMFKKSAVQEAGGYLDWFSNEDYYLWIRMYLKGAVFANVDDNLVMVRIGKEQYRRRGGLKYFRSEAGIQRLMLKEGIIGLGRYVVNVGKRLIIQVLMPNRIRGFLIAHLARKSA